MNVSEVLNRAADLIEERGWVQGADGMKIGGPHCILGSIAAAAGTDEWTQYGKYHYNPAETHPAGIAIAAHVEDCEIFLWNDAPERTAEEVIETLRAAAIIAAASEVDVRTVEPVSVSC